MYEDCKVYGPYIQGKRKIIILKFKDGSTKTTSHARFLYEKHHDRVLTDSETVDHIDGDSLNDTLSNLQVLSLRDNIQKSSKPSKVIQVDCERCGSPFEVELRVFKRNQITLKKAGPYCSKHCAGKVHN